MARSFLPTLNSRFNFNITHGNKMTKRLAYEISDTSSSEDEETNDSSSDGYESDDEEMREADGEDRDDEDSSDDALPVKTRQSSLRLHPQILYSEEISESNRSERDAESDEADADLSAEAAQAVSRVYADAASASSCAGWLMRVSGPGEGRIWLCSSPTM